MWQHATLREANGKTTHYQDREIRFLPQRTWRSPRTGASYPVEMVIETDTIEKGTLKKNTTRWHLQPLQDDQELDSRASTGAVYWEGAVSIQRNNQPAGRGYFEMTGYDKPLKL
jgi:predicted secreted hydrolase